MYISKKPSQLKAEIPCVYPAMLEASHLDLIKDTVFLYLNPVKFLFFPIKTKIMKIDKKINQRLWFVWKEIEAMHLFFLTTINIQWAVVMSQALCRALVIQRWIKMNKVILDLRSSGLLERQTGEPVTTADIVWELRETHRGHHASPVEATIPDREQWIDTETWAGFRKTVVSMIAWRERSGWGRRPVCNNNGE